MALIAIYDIMEYMISLLFDHLPTNPHTVYEGLTIPYLLDKIDVEHQQNWRNQNSQTAVRANRMHFQ